jgi:hypothetical protein
MAVNIVAVGIKSSQFAYVFVIPNTFISLSVNAVLGVRFQTYTIVCLKVISNHATVYPPRECEALSFW